ncbi:MAG: hypothetical protein AAF430_24180 [Myxococcota bacterium]
MSPEECLVALRELAGEFGLEVRAAGPPDAPPTSGVCRVRGEIWVVLVAGEPAARQVDALVEGLRAHAGPALEERYLPPAIRALLEP